MSNTGDVTILCVILMITMINARIASYLKTTNTTLAPTHTLGNRDTTINVVPYKLVIFVLILVVIGCILIVLLYTLILHICTAKIYCKTQKTIEYETQISIQVANTFGECYDTMLDNNSDDKKPIYVSNDTKTAIIPEFDHQMEGNTDTKIIA
mmetsp:Transcript_39609/g.48997  ORF Transcript_39609/g.48997 Transcript_39609/m.48997 type:complete len:153 (+) Transcript_39609:44-502(+)